MKCDYCDGSGECPEMCGADEDCEVCNGTGDCPHCEFGETKRGREITGPDSEEN